MLRVGLLFLVLLGSSVALPAQQRVDSLLAPLTDVPLAAGTFRQWVGGAEVALSPEATKDGPPGIVWGAKGKIGYRGVKFGEGLQPGPRYLRIGWEQPVKVGSVLVRAGGTLSVLKPGAEYPGDLANDAQWTPAERLLRGEVVRTEVGKEEYTVWVLPPGTETRALRFSHVPEAGDAEYAGWVGGMWVTPQRLGNVAPQALAQSSSPDEVSARLVDELTNHTWQAWDNGAEGAALPLSPEHPETITLTWPQPVQLGGLCLVWPGFDAVEVDTFIGTADGNPRDAAEANWRKVASSDKLDAFYPVPLSPNWLAFPGAVETRALRLRITRPSSANHEHLRAGLKGGRRAWLGEVLALTPLPQAPLASLVLPKSEEEPPPIPIKFTLKEAGLVTLVIEDTQQHRVRNLVSETPFPAGENTAWWDGSDDLLRDTEAAKHGLYHIPFRPVAPGTYQVRGLWHPPLQLRYEFNIYSAGKPAWTTEDKTGGWMTNHTPPTSVAFVPGNRTKDGEPLLFMGAQVSEGGHGLQWVHEDGRKLGGQGWVGGTWTGAPTLAVDQGPAALQDHLCYVGSIWEGELRLTAKGQTFEDKPICKVSLGADPLAKTLKPAEKPTPLPGFDGGEQIYVLGSLAARDGVIVGSLVRQNELILVEAKSGRILGRASVENPRGLAFDAAGRLLVLSGTKLVRYPALAATNPAQLGAAEILISRELEDPRQITTDADGNFFISDRGAAHQVKVFSPAGRLLRAVGLAGAPSAGPYEKRHLNNPNGVAVDSQGRLWVAEADNQPRRVSVWSPQGTLVRGFLGPAEYGGGGTLDPRDPTRFYYRGLEFKLDWQAGSDELVRVFHRPDPLAPKKEGSFSPDTPLYPEAQPGQRYFTSCYTHNPTGGDQLVFLWRDEPAQARLVAAVGNARSWEALLAPEFRALWPAGTKPEKENPQPNEQATFAWTDGNGDGRPQPDEVKFSRTYSRGFTVMNDLAVVCSRFGEQTARFVPTFTVDKNPIYHLAEPETLGPAGNQPVSSGGDQALREAGGWTINTNAPQPFAAQSLGGSFRGEPRWSYPSAWPGLHASHEGAVPDRPGMVVGHTRLLGGWVNPPGQGGPLFCVNGNMGNMYLFTADGLFVSTLFHDIRLRQNWAMPVAVRGMNVSNVSLHDENFWPSITQVPDGRVFLVDGGHSSLVRIDGLSAIERLPEQMITVTAEDLAKTRAWFTRAEARRQQQRGSGTLQVAFRSQPPVVDGRIDDWPATTEWATIDRRGTKANFNSNSKPYDVSAAVAISGDRLFAAWRSNEKDLLNNSGETPNALFKTGGCLDMMLGTEAPAASEHKQAGPGDERLLVTLVKGQPRALLYRARVPGTAQPVAFSSPDRTIQIDVVEDVSDRLALATDNQGNYEISLPLEALHWRPKAGETVHGDLGILRGSNFQTTQRVYWSNKATAITADVPSEAELSPSLWGKWVLKAE